MQRKGKAELICAQIKTKYGETFWTKEEHEEKIQNNLESLEKIIKSSQRVTPVEDFN